ncbi:DNA topoisomerase 1 beta-like [Cucurbita maxima]|uniref:DNA topoisomerase I n=1 Tax=Cucurbita maxima TaxID=3661 RepID=A0A6J1KZE0_CUCMA|nr:DNA topoisomerase 1 beta-like [Cucurbita maxima]XP_023007687.1 DNA topoisomerase 1 beta-like [Cucurbita maxima]XP_023007688.1 DNA topoisomerase 1 beta-like [Cucurbita maxima]XP_023007689.1 DNA topoisomerase 1 beta-like [Cucurbita maxima]
MAVETFGKATMFDDDDEDNMPIVFKRSSASRQNQLNSEVKHSQSQRLNQLSGRPGSDACSTNGQSSNAQKRMTSLPKTSPMRPEIGSQKASKSSIQEPLVKSLGTTLKVSDSMDSRPKQLVNAAVKEENDSIHPAQENSDSEDDKPLSIRLKGNSNHPSKGPIPTVQKNKIKKSSEDSDDEVPLSSKFRMKSASGVLGGKQHGFDEKKPLDSKVHQNGSTSSDKLQKPAVVSSKRPLPNADSHSSSQISSKKPKLSDSSTPLSTHTVSLKAKQEVVDDDDHIPISQRMKMSAAVNKSSGSKKTVSKVASSSIKKTLKKSKKPVKKSKYVKSTKLLPSSGDGQKKWTTLVHNGVIFPPPYQTHGVKILHKGKPVDLTPEQEEVATMFAVMKDTDYMQKPKFKENFWNDWRKLLGKNHVIQNLDDCDFTPIYDWYQTEKEKKKQMTTEEKKALKEEKLKQEEKYMWAILDGVKEKVGNFRVEPPGLFRGRGEHPKMGKLKKRIRPSDITINIGKDAPIPECPIPGQRWKEVRHDNTVTWLAFWNDPINPKEFKYVFLAASSSLKGQSDKEKYEKARMLKDYIKNIRNSYTKDFTSKDPTRRQIAVATYLIDKLALRAGNEKDDDEADTVGCCTLKVENVKAVPPNLLEFNFLGKDSIKYENTVEVELPVFKAITQFQSGKSGSDDLFDKLDTSKLNAHLKDLMPGLTAKVFRTYNASITLDDMLNRGTKDGEVSEKIVTYQHANKEVAIICNHQRTVSKSHGAQMTRLNEKISELRDILKELKIDLDRAKKGKPPLKGSDGKQKRNLTPEALEKKISQTNAKIEKIERDMKTKEDLKTVALGTSKINYLDPRITVAWCKRHEVPIEKIFNKSLLAKFAWAMDVDPDFRF